MSRQFFMGFVFFVSMIFLGNFAWSVSTKDVSTEEKINTALEFKDIPVPAGFKPDMKNSFIFKNDAVRVGMIKYLGQGDISEITSFYKKQMALFNWELLTSIEYMKSVLIFETEVQSAVAIIEQQGKTISITIASGPKNATSFDRFKSLKK